MNEREAEEKKAEQDRAHEELKPRQQEAERRAGVVGGGKSSAPLPLILQNNLHRNPGVDLIPQISPEQDLATLTRDLPYVVAETEDSKVWLECTEVFKMLEACNKAYKIHRLLGFGQVLRASPFQ